MDEIAIRPIEQRDVPLLKEFTYLAIFQPEGGNRLPREILEEPGIVHYYKNFLAFPHDDGLLAQRGEQVIGAVWVRLLNAKPKGYGNIDDKTPEFSIAVLPQWRGRGLGSRLMKEMLVRLKEKGCSQASLSVQRANAAARLYARLGFKVVEEREEDDLMVITL